MNPDFFIQSLRMSAVVRKMKRIGFESFSIADLMYPDPVKTLTFFTMLIHMVDEVIPRLNRIFNSKLELSEFHRERNHPESRWVAINRGITEAKILKEKLLNSLENYR